MSSADLRARGSGEQGFTLLELVIAMGILSIVMAVVGASLVSITGATRSTEEKSIADTTLRAAVERIARDVRAARPIDSQTPVSIYDTQIAFKVYCSTVGGTCASGNTRQIVYRVISNRLEVSVAGGSFVRLVAPSATSQLPVTSRQFAIVNNPTTEPVFTYLRDNGSALATGGASPAPPERFRDCTQAVRIHLRMITVPGNTAEPADLTTTVTLRNFNEVTGCT